MALVEDMIGFGSREAYFTFINNECRLAARRIMVKRGSIYGFDGLWNWVGSSLDKERGREEEMIKRAYYLY